MAHSALEPHAALHSLRAWRQDRAPRSWAACGVPVSWESDRASRNVQSNEWNPSKFVQSVYLVLELEIGSSESEWIPSARYNFIGIYSSPDSCNRFKMNILELFTEGGKPQFTNMLQGNLGCPKETWHGNILPTIVQTKSHRRTSHLGM